MIKDSLSLEVEDETKLFPDSYWLWTTNSSLDHVKLYISRDVFSGGCWGALALPELGVLLTLFQPEGADYAHHISASTPGFENLKTSFTHLTIICISFRIYTIVVVQKNPFSYEAVPFVFLVSFCTCRPLIVQANLFSKSLFVHHFMKKRIEQNFYMILACFIYFNTEISVMGRTEISIMECTDRNFCAPHYRK